MAPEFKFGAKQQNIDRNQYEGARRGNNKHPVVTLVLVFAVLMMADSYALAVEPAVDNSPQPILFSADRSVFDQKANRAVLEGRVKVTQAESTIWADRMIIFLQKSGSQPADMDPDSIERIEAEGNVRIEFDRRVATGEKAEYRAFERKLVISGPGAKFIDGRDEISADKITYYRDDGRVEFAGSTTQQIKGIMHTRQKGLN